MKRLKFKFTFAEECLGTASGNPALYEEYIISKREPTSTGTKQEESASLPPVEEEIEKSMTVFSRNADGKPILWDYQIKGFFKDACSSLSRVKGYEKTGDEGTISSKTAAFKKVIDGTIFVFPRQIELQLPQGGEIGVCQRPLRAQTAQGERIALSISETVPVGTWFECEIALLDPKTEPLVMELLEYGALRGLGQWRNSGKGRFTFAKAS